MIRDASTGSLGSTIAAAYLNEATDEAIPVNEANTAATPKSDGTNSRATTGTVRSAMAAAIALPDIITATLLMNSECARRTRRMTVGIGYFKVQDLEGPGIGEGYHEQGIGGSSRRLLLVLRYCMPRQEIPPMFRLDVPGGHADCSMTKTPIM
jgi:hypothetical protein